MLFSVMLIGAKGQGEAKNEWKSLARGVQYAAGGNPEGSKSLGQLFKARV